MQYGFLAFSDHLYTIHNTTLVYCGFTLMFCIVRCFLVPFPHYSRSYCTYVAQFHFSFYDKLGLGLGLGPDPSLKVIVGHCTCQLALGMCRYSQGWNICFCLKRDIKCCILIFFELCSHLETTIKYLKNVYLYFKMQDKTQQVWESKGPG